MKTSPLSPASFPHSSEEHASMTAVACQTILPGTQGQIITQAIEAMAVLLEPMAQEKATGRTYACHQLPDLHSQQPK